MMAASFGDKPKKSASKSNTPSSTAADYT